MFIGFTGFIIIIHFIKLKVLTKDPVIETEIKGFLRICLRIQPEYDLRLVDLQQSFRRQVQTGRTGHFTCGAFYPDKFISLKHRRFVMEDLSGDHAACLIASARTCMILAAWFEVNTLISPAHRPVDFPCQLAAGIFFKIKCPLVSAFAFVFCHCTILGNGCDLRHILMAFRTENAYWKVCITFPFLSILSPEAVQNVKDLFSLLDRLDDIITVCTGSVHICLIAIIHFDTEFLNGFHKFIFEVFRIIFVFRIKRIRNRCIRSSNILLHLVFRIYGFYVSRHFTKPVKLIP